MGVAWKEWGQKSVVPPPPPPWSEPFHRQCSHPRSYAYNITASSLILTQSTSTLRHPLAPPSTTILPHPPPQSYPTFHHNLTPPSATILPHPPPQSYPTLRHNLTPPSATILPHPPPQSYPPSATILPHPPPQSYPTLHHPLTPPLVTILPHPPPQSYPTFHHPLTPPSDRTLRHPLTPPSVILSPPPPPPPLPLPTPPLASALRHDLYLLWDWLPSPRQVKSVRPDLVLSKPDESPSQANPADNTPTPPRRRPGAVPGPSRGRFGAGHRHRSVFIGR